MKRKAIPFLILIVLLTCFACAGIQAKWQVLTPDAKARIVISDLQGQLDNLFTQGKAYVTANPSKQVEWKNKVNPSFDVANKALADVIAIGKTKPLTPDFVYARVQNSINLVLSLLNTLGVK